MRVERWNYREWTVHSYGMGLSGFGWMKECVVRSSCVVCCAWKTKCGGKVGPMQQSLTSEDPVRQVPDLMPTETALSSGQAGGDVCFSTAYRSSLNRKDWNFCHVLPKQMQEAP